MRRTLLCAVALLVLSACHGEGRSVMTKMWTNEKNSAEVLKLEHERSVYNHMTGLLHRGFEEGEYTLTTAVGTTSGTYKRSQQNKTIMYAFQPKDGKKWSFELQEFSDGSFTNDRGVWKPSTSPTRVEEKAPALVKVGG